MKRFAAALAFAFASLAAFPAYATEVIRIVAAENFYGDIAAAVGGAHVRVTSILNNPDEDPHLFEASPSVARDLAAARIVVLNGADYDPWVAKLLSANAEAGRSTMVAADLVGRTPGDNPHLWYDPATMPTVAGALATALDAIDPANKADYDNNLKLLDASLQKIVDKVASIRARFEGAEVTATEPVFGYMAAALGLKVRNERFQLAVMNDTEPSARDTAAMEADLKGRRVKVFFYNNQVTDPLTERLLKIANDANVPVVGVSETQPAGKSFAAWMLTQLDATEKALAGPSS
jgi:zinc/manganese transport system substrate-binding protein